MGDTYKCVVYNKSFITDIVHSCTKSYVNIYCPDLKIIIQIDPNFKTVVGAFESDTDGTEKQIINSRTGETSEGTNIREVNISKTFIDASFQRTKVNKIIEDEVKSVMASLK